ncbi:hypothetical protein [Candidatus Skiveiella danica]|uniref:phage major capsid protein n=1 Tax=Candidatus Skiveiella danica TaxID=3386177 RepID=UPI0039B8D1C6
MNYTEFNSREVMSAAPDAIAMGTGASVNRPHPLASELTLRKIAYACGRSLRKPQPYDTEMSIAASGMGSPEFARLFADGVSSVTIQSYRGQSEHLAIASLFDAPNFYPSQIPALDSAPALEPLAENAEIKQGLVMMAAGAQDVTLTTFARAITIAREDIINDNQGAIGRVFAELGASAGRIEARLMADALEANPVLDDGAVTFDAAYSNVVAEAFGWAALISATTLLRTQLTQAGQRADLKAKFLVVAPELELPAQNEVTNAGLDIKVLSLANLPTGRWYVLADPMVCPVVGVLRLAGAKNPVRVEQAKRPLHVDGACVKVTADLGACLLRRSGIVRGGA